MRRTVLESMTYGWDGSGCQPRRSRRPNRCSNLGSLGRGGPPGGVRTLSVVARTKPAPPDRGSTDDGRQAGQGCGRRKSREHCGPRLKLTWEFPGFLCARGDLNPHALSDTGT